VRDKNDDLVHHFADLTVDTTLTHLPPDAIEAAKKSLLDTIGVTLAAGGLEPIATPVLEHVRENGGRPEATVLGTDLKVPAGAAAFANGALAHCLDFDDLTYWGHHAASSIVPATLAAAERRGCVSGEELVVAIAVGQDIFARLRRHVEWRKDWNISPVMGVFAAAAAAGRVLGLSREQVAHALGIASMRSAGTMEIVQGVSDVRGIYAGFSGEGAVTAALLAERGVTGLSALFEGEYGVLNTYFRGDYDRSAILKDLGITYMGGSTLYKRWPSVSTSHSHIHAMMMLMAEQDLSAEDLEEIRVFVGDWHDVMCRPLESRRVPKTVLDAKFSLPFLVSLAVVRGDIGVTDLTEPSLEDPAVLELARKVVPIPDAALDWNLEIPPGRVQVTTRDGRTFDQSGVDVPGTVDAPMTWQDIGRKFGDCAAAASVPLRPEQIQAVKQMAEELETLADALDLVRGLA
jgi:2-methylcitrate dehydratase PrpD